MAFEFLANIPFEQISSIGQAATGFFGLFRDPPSATRDIPGLQSALDAAEAARVYGAAAVDPESPHFKNLAALEEASRRRDIIKTINEIMLSNRRSRASGRVGFGINPERRDEVRAATIVEQFLRAGIGSRDVASQRLSQASQRAAGAAAAFGPTFAPFESYAARGREQERGSVEALFKTIGAFGDLFSSGGATSGLGSTFQGTTPSAKETFLRRRPYIVGPGLA